MPREVASFTHSSIHLCVCVNNKITLILDKFGIVIVYNATIASIQQKSYEKKNEDVKTDLLPLFLP